MFPLQRSGELCFSSISSSDPNYQPPDPNILRQDHHLSKITHNHNNNNNGAAAAVASSAPLQIIGSTGQNKVVFSAANNNTKMSRRKRLATSNEEEEEEESGENNNDKSCNSSKKKKHREVEKQRRQEMASLFVSLRSLLPLEFIRGKRSISDHINEAVNYIRHLEAKKKELEGKRNALIKISSNSSPCVDSKDGIRRKSSNSVIVQPWCAGNQILITRSSDNSGQEEAFPLSVVMELLSQQGLDIVSSLSTQLNNTTLIHKIYCEAANEESSPMNLTELCKKLEEVIGG